MWQVRHGLVSGDSVSMGQSLHWEGDAALHFRQAPPTLSVAAVVIPHASAGGALHLWPVPPLARSSAPTASPSHAYALLLLSLLNLQVVPVLPLLLEGRMQLFQTGALNKVRRRNNLAVCSCIPASCFGVPGVAGVVAC